MTPRYRALRPAMAAVLLALVTAATPAQAQDSGVSKDIPFTGGGTGRVTVSKTTAMRREVVRVTWSGFTPTKNVDGLPFNALQPSRERFPVAVMQCRGKDPKREDCVWYAEDYERYAAFWEDPVEAPTPDRYPSGMVPFTDLDGTSWALNNCTVAEEPVCEGPTRRPADWMTFGRQGRIGFTAADGTGAVDFDVRTGDEMPKSLGCGRGDSGGDCSLVVVPVRQMPCIPETAGFCDNATDDSFTGLNNYTHALSGFNWQHRAVFPMDFLPAEGYCPLDGAGRVGIVGSEIAAEAVYRWVPALCTGPTKVPASYTPLTEGEARRQYVSGQQNFAVVNRPVTADRAGRATAHAPLAVGAFAVAFLLDRPDNFQQATDLKLNARLVAKLITQAYRGVWTMMPDASGQDPTRGYLPKNPDSLEFDPEFQELNPGVLTGRVNESTLATPMLVTGDGDIPHELTRWLLADPDAAAFLRGTPDKWGTRINPAFADWQLPAEKFDYRDGSVADPGARPDKDGNCGSGGVTYFCARHVAQLQELLAQRVSRLRDVGTNMVIGTNLQTTDWDPVYRTWKRPAAQLLGRRALFGVTDFATAVRYRLPMAALSTGGSAGGKPVFVGPSEDSMLTALRSGTLDKATGVLSLDYDKLKESGGYPGTIVTYGAVATTGLKPELGGQYATIIEYAAGDGQTVGPNVGQLPLGYLPLPPELREQARLVAKAVREQKAEVPPPPFDDPSTISAPPGTGGTSKGGASGKTGTGPATPGGAAPVAAPPAAQPGGETPAVQEKANRASVATKVDRSGWLRWALPGLLGLGLLAALVVPVAVLGSRPGTPVNRWLVGLRARVRG